MSLIQAITQRYTDWLHERAIKAAQAELDSLDKPTSHDGQVYADAYRLQQEIDSLKAKRVGNGR